MHAIGAHGLLVHVYLKGDIHLRHSGKRKCQQSGQSVEFFHLFVRLSLLSVHFTMYQMYEKEHIR